METPMWVALGGLVMYMLGRVLDKGAFGIGSLISSAIWYALGTSVVFYALMCTQRDVGCAGIAWFLAILTLLFGFMMLLAALFMRLAFSGVSKDVERQQKTR